MKRLCLCLMGALLSLSCLAQQATPQQGAQKQPTPEEMRKLMEATMAPMVPIMAKMTDALIDVTLQKGEDPATAKKIAKFKRNLYDALLKEGFDKEQAFAIMQSTSMPIMSPSMK